MPDPTSPNATQDADTKDESVSLDFIRQMIADDITAGKHAAIVTRFPPEPNGFLHIGHAKALCLNFGIPQEVARGELGDPVPSRCHLRFDDTNPTKEEQRYIDAIKEDIHWLGFDWGEHEYYASNYFHQLYDWACALIRTGNAYVDDQTADEMRANRGTLTEPGKPSPFRDRPPEENLELFERMKSGEFPDGSRVLRAKIDMAAPNMNLRDPAMYRILHATHPKTGDEWCVYPMYDYAHGQSDWIEGVTHSLCSLEFEDHRPLYDWFVDKLIEIGEHPRKDAQGEFDPNDRPRQTEFNRLNVTHTVMSKRKLRELVETGRVAGWDDPRMPTQSGMRRRGYPPMALRNFVHGAGLSKRNQTIDLSRLEHAVREQLNKTCSRVMAVLDPIKLVITDYPEDKVEHMEAVNNPEDEAAGTRTVPFTRELYIERADFMIDAPKKYFRLAPGREVRLRYGYWVTCVDHKTDDAGNVTEIHCTHDPETRGGNNPPPDAEGKVRKVKGTIHWVSAAHALDAEVRLYETLFAAENPNKEPESGDWHDNLNPDSLTVNANAKVEPHLQTIQSGETVQFERTGYFAMDTDSTDAKLVFNRTVPLRDSWGKIQGK